MCIFIKNSHNDLTKRKCPSRESKNNDEKKLSRWINSQKINYYSNGPQHSKQIMKTLEIWTIWNKTIVNPEYMYALFNSEEQWKYMYEQMCIFIKNSHNEPIKRNFPSTVSKNEDEKKLGGWVSYQKKNYDDNGSEHSKNIMKIPEIWTIWNKTLVDQEYMYALLDSDGQWKIKYEQMCTYIIKSNKDQTKRKCPSQESNNEDENKVGKWVGHQKQNYDSNGSDHSKYNMETPEIWKIWNKTLINPEYMYALLDFDGQWKYMYEQMCTFIKESHNEPEKRKRQSTHS